MPIILPIHWALQGQSNHMGLKHMVVGEITKNAFYFNNLD